MCARNAARCQFNDPGLRPGRFGQVDRLQVGFARRTLRRAKLGVSAIGETLAASSESDFLQFANTEIFLSIFLVSLPECALANSKVEIDQLGVSFV